MKLILNPSSLISRSSLAIVKSSFATHHIIFEISLIIWTFLVYHLSSTLFDSINHKTFEITTILILFRCEYWNTWTSVWRKLQNFNVLLTCDNVIEILMARFINALKLLFFRVRAWTFLFLYVFLVIVRRWAPIEIFLAFYNRCVLLKRSHWIPRIFLERRVDTGMIGSWVLDTRSFIEYRWSLNGINFLKVFSNHFQKFWVCEQVFFTVLRRSISIIGRWYIIRVTIVSSCMVDLIFDIPKRIRRSLWIVCASVISSVIWHFFCFWLIIYSLRLF